MKRKYEYNKEHAKNYLEKFDEIKIRVPAGKKDEFKAMAAEAGKSLNQYIIDCVEAQKKKLIIVEGHFLEGEKVTVSIDCDEVQRKVYYSKEAGDLFVLYKGNKYFYYEFQE